MTTLPDILLRHVWWVGLLSENHLRIWGLTLGTNKIHWHRTQYSASRKYAAHPWFLIMAHLNDHQFDAMVIGGGPAGSAFAITAATAGLKVILFEQAHKAHHKVCGEFLSHETQILLAELGIDLDNFNAPSQTSLRLVNGNQAVDASLPFTGRSLSRLTLDELLLEQASCAGVTIERGVKVTHLSTDDEASSATVTVSSGPKISAPLVALATGASTVRGIKARKISELVGFKIVLSLNTGSTESIRDRVQLMGYDGGYQGMLLVEGQMASLAWIMPSSQAKILSNDWNRHREFLSAQSEFVGDMLVGSKTDWKKPLAVSGLQFGFLRNRSVGHNIYPVGRQMAIIPSFTGDGLAIALATGIYAAQSAIRGETVDVYQKQMRKNLRQQFWWARAVHPMFLTGWTRATGLGLARRLPGIVRLVTNATRLNRLPDLNAFGPKGRDLPG